MAVAVASVVVSIVGVIAWFGSDERTTNEIAFVAAYVIGCVLAGIFLWFNSRRVTAICREFLLGAFTHHGRDVANDDS